MKKPAVCRLVGAACLGLLSIAPPPPAGAATAVPGPVIGQPAPAFNLPTIDGRHVTLEDYRGKTLVINIWATWCPPCQRETPDLIAAYKKLGNDQVAFLSVDSTERADLVRAFVAAKNIAWTNAVDEHRSFEHAYGVRYFPTTWVIDPQGILRATYIDMITPNLLAGFVQDAEAGKNGVIASRSQAKIDALLAPEKFSFTGSPAEVDAAVAKLRKAMDAAEKINQNADPSKDAVDFRVLQSEENALRVRAIAALKPVATTAKRKVTLALLEGESNSYAGNYRAALADYRTAVALDPKNPDALQGLSMNARWAKNYAEMLRADKALVALDPNDVEANVSLGIDYGVAHDWKAAKTQFDRAVDVATAKADAPKADAPKAKVSAIRMLAWTHLYYGRTEAKAGDAAAARRQFALAMQTTMRLPKSDSRYTIYMEQAQEETVAIDLGSRTHTTTSISLAPWTGPELPGSAPDTAKYRLVVTGPAGKTVTLRAADLPKGWIASFCLDRICAPLHVTTTLPQNGVKVIEFQVVPPESRLLARVPSVRVIATTGKSMSSARTVALR